MAVKQLDRFLETLQIMIIFPLVEVTVEDVIENEDNAMIWSIKSTLIPIETNR